MICGDDNKHNWRCITGGWDTTQGTWTRWGWECDPTTTNRWLCSRMWPLSRMEGWDMEGGMPPEQLPERRLPVSPVVALKFSAAVSSDMHHLCLPFLYLLIFSRWPLLFLMKGKSSRKVEILKKEYSLKYTKKVYIFDHFLSLLNHILIFPQLFFNEKLLLVAVFCIRRPKLHLLYDFTFLFANKTLLYLFWPDVAWLTDSQVSTSREYHSCLFVAKNTLFLFPLNLLVTSFSLVSPRELPLMNSIPCFHGEVEWVPSKYRNLLRKYEEA